MIRDALTQKLKNHLLILNVLEPEQTLFYIYKVCGVGGPDEVRALLKRLSDPLETDD